MWWRWCNWCKNDNKDKIIWNEREWIVEYINKWMKDGLIIWIERGDSKRVEWSIELKECLWDDCWVFWWIFDMINIVCWMNDECIIE